MDQDASEAPKILLGARDVPRWVWAGDQCAQLGLLETHALHKEGTGFQ